MLNAGITAVLQTVQSIFGVQCQDGSRTRQCGPSCGTGLQTGGFIES